MNLLAMAEPEIKHDQNVRSLLDDPKISSFRKYQLMTAGKPGLFGVFVYDTLTAICGNFPGAIGYGLRQKLYTRLFTSLGKGALIGRNCTFRGVSQVHIGRGVVIDDNVVIDARGSAEVRIGDGVFIGRNSIIRARDGRIEIRDHADIGSNTIVSTDTEVTIGSHVLIAAYTYICGGGNHCYDRRDIPITEQGFDRLGGIQIGDGAWIGSHAMVMDGASVGEGAIVGSHAVVRDALPAMQICVGTPAKAIKPRPGE